MLTQKDIAEHLDLSQQSVSGLCAEMGIEWRSVSLDEVRVLYIRRLREQAAGRAASGDLDLATERARLAKEQADKIAMQNAISRNELAPVYLLEEVLAKAGARAAKILETIPGTIKRRAPGLSADTLAAIARDVAKVRNLAASVRLADLVDDDDQEEDVVADQEVAD